MAKKATPAKRGRPRKHDYDKVFEEWPPPPSGDPVKLAEWAGQICAQAMSETIRGRGNRELNAEIRSFAGVILRTVPIERLAEVERMIAESRKARGKPAATKGPRTEVVQARPTGSSGRAPIRG